MKILVRHLFMNLLKPMLYLLAAFTLLFVIADLMDHGSDLLRSDASVWMILHYYGLQLPSLVIFIVPICLLLATLYSLSTLTRHSEIVAMRASGVSIYRIVRPYLLMGLICFSFTAVVNEYFGPKYAYRAHQLLKSQTDKTQDPYYDSIPFVNSTAGHNWYIQQFDTRPPKYVMRGITLRIQRPDGSDKEKITASKGQWIDHHWWFEDGTIQHFDKNNTLIQRYDKNGKLLSPTETFPLKEMRDLPEIPEDFLGEAKPSEFQSSLELKQYIDTHQFLSKETLTKYRVDLHHKLTMPFICLIATIIGIPVGAHTGRKGALAGIMLAIGMFFGFYALQFTMEYLAKQMLIAPWIGAWTAIIVFGLIGSIEIHRMR